MKKLLLTILVLVLTTICTAQTTKTKYYNNRFLEKEVSFEKAKFSESITHSTDGTITTEVKDLKLNEVIRSETFKGKEPTGIWIYKRSKITYNLDYDFTVKYVDEKSDDCVSKFKIKDYFHDFDSLNYKAPKIITGETLNEFISNNLIYPVQAQEDGAQGKVYTTFTVTKEGKIENVLIKKGVHFLLDKEAARVLKSLKFTSPPTVDGKPETICVTIPISFTLM